MNDKLPGSSRTVLVGLLAVGALAAAVAVAARTGRRGAGPAAPSAEASSAGAEGPWRQEALVPVSSDDPALGPRSAPVTVVMFSDYECPFSAFEEPTVQAVRAHYGDKVRVVWKALPLASHPHAYGAAVSATTVFLAKGADAFWKFHGVLFKNQKQLDKESLVKLLLEAGVDDATQARLAPDAAQRVKASVELSQRLALHGTPNFVIDGEVLTGAQPLDKFKHLIDAHLLEAQKKRAAGVSEANLYAAMVEHFQSAQANAPKPPAPEEKPEDPTVWKVPVGASAARGPKDAPVTLVLFSDFECPYCKRLEPTLAQLSKDYGDALRIVWKNQPLPNHARAIPAALAAWEVRKQKGDAGFWRMHDALFESAPKLGDADLEAAAQAVAKELPGLDVTKVMAAVNTKKWLGEIEAEMDEAQALRVEGTPRAFINGRVVDGAQPIARYKRLIDAALAAAQAKIKGGTPAAAVYEDAIKDGKLAVVPLAVPASAPVLGPKDAKIVLHVFGDFECPFCKRVEVAGSSGGPSALAAVREKYQGQIAIVWHDLPLSVHPRAWAAATFAREARAQKGDAAFWQVHDALFESQPKLADADLEAIAGKLGLDWAKCKAAIDTDKYRADIGREVDEGKRLGIGSTPGVIVQTKDRARRLDGALPAEAFFKAIDRLLKP